MSWQHLLLIQTASSGFGFWQIWLYMSLVSTSMYSNNSFIKKEVQWQLVNTEIIGIGNLYVIRISVLSNKVMKGAWHENFEKLILLKLPDQVSFHLNISSTMKKLQTYISFRINRRKLFLCYLLFYIVWWPCFLISKHHFYWYLLNYLEYSHQILPQKSEKYDQTFGTKIRVSLKKIGGMMLWIMSSWKC